MASRQTSGIRSIRGFFTQESSRATSSAEASVLRIRHTSVSPAEFFAAASQRLRSASSASIASAVGGARDELAPTESTLSGTNSGSSTIPTDPSIDPATATATTATITGGDDGEREELVPRESTVSSTSSGSSSTTTTSDVFTTGGTGGTGGDEEREELEPTVNVALGTSSGSPGATTTSAITAAATMESVATAAAAAVTVSTPAAATTSTTIATATGDAFIDASLSNPLYDPTALTSESSIPITITETTIMRKLVDYCDGMSDYKKSIANEIRASTNSEKQRKQVIDVLESDDDRPRILKLLSRTISIVAYLFLCVTPGNLTQRESIVRYIRQMEEYSAEDERETVQAYLTEAQNNPDKLPEKPRTVFLDKVSLMMSILLAWALCADNTDPDISAERRETVERAISTASPGQSPKPAFYHWQLLYRSLHKKLTRTVVLYLQVLRGEVDNALEKTQKRKGRINDVDGAEGASLAEETTAIAQPRGPPSGGGASEVVAEEVSDRELVPQEGGSDPASDDVINNTEKTPAPVRTKRALVIHQHAADAQETKRIKLFSTRGLFKKEPIVVYPNGATDAQFKKATMVFFPLLFEDLVSVEHLKVFDFQKKKLCPVHMTCIIGINEELLVQIASFKRISPLFEDLRTFSYLVPSKINTKRLYDCGKTNGMNDGQEGTTPTNSECDKLLRNFLLEMFGFRYYTELDVLYAANDIRTVTVLSASPMEVPNTQSDDYLAKKTFLNGVKTAIRQTNSFGVGGGSHSFSDEELVQLTQLIGLKNSDVVWDIGVGNPTMAFFFSMLTNREVVGTDIDPIVISGYEGVAGGLPKRAVGTLRQHRASSTLSSDDEE